MKRYSVLLMICLGLAIVFVWHQQQQITKLTTTRLLEHQKICADQAQKMFVSLGWKMNGEPVGTLRGAYTSHYNSQMDKCFMELDITNVSGRWSEDDSVTDAFEGYEYAHYAAFDAFTNDDNKNMIVRRCALTLSGQPVRQCNSKEEWQKLILPLMQEG